MKNLNGKILAALLAAGAATSAEACTSWVIHPSVSASGRMLVQKCRDSRVTPLDADIRRSRHGVKWMRIGMYKHCALFAVSEKGLVAIMNDGDDMTLKHPNNLFPELKDTRTWTACAETMRQIMDECTTAEEATRLTLHYCRNKLQAGHGGTMFIADPKRAFMIDLGPGYGEAKEITGGMIIITNCMHLPGVEEFSIKSVGSTRSDRSREANTRAELRKRRVNGKYTVLGTIETSRLRCQDSMTKKYPCRRNSLGGCCFELDPEFPAELTTAYIALGPQQHTVYVPAPMTLEQFPQEIVDSSWADLAYKLRERVGFDHQYIERFAAYEAKILPEYDKVREEARALLKAGKKDEAVKLLNECFARQYAEALKLLKDTLAEAPENPEKLPADV
jgi:uncharacterized protein (DUF2237 family)